MNSYSFLGLDRCKVNCVSHALPNYYEDTVRFGHDIVPLLRQMGVVQ
jgi:hypothetical protein